jgi:geranylgeranyl diphosphate synthase type II
MAIRIVEELSEASGADGMVKGQALDLEFQGKAKNKTVSEKINILKTAKLFQAAAKMGALTAGASAKELKALGRFGLDFGLSFQMVDDNLDGDGVELKESALLIKRAKNDLEIFGKRADRLKRIIEEASKRTI